MNPGCQEKMFMKKTFLKIKVFWLSLFTRIVGWLCWKFLLPSLIDVFMIRNYWENTMIFSLLPAHHVNQLLFFCECGVNVCLYALCFWNHFTCNEFYDIQCPSKVWRQSKRNCSFHWCMTYFICISIRLKWCNWILHTVKSYMNAQQTCECIVTIYFTPNVSEISERKMLPQN